MKRREFIKAALATGALYTGGGLPGLGRVAQANGFPALANRVLVNIMLSGGPDFRHLLPPPFDSNPDSYGYQYWQARAGAHAIDQASSAYQARWANDYFHVGDGMTEFGILRKCGWLKRMWDAGNVAIVSNAFGGSSRNHAHCQLIMEQGNLTSAPNDTQRPGWGGRLAVYAGGNVVALTRIPEAFAFGPHASNPDQRDGRNVISARDMRQLALYRPGDDVSALSPKRYITRSLQTYYAALQQEMRADSVYHRFVEHERSLREFAEPIEDRLSTVPVPAPIAVLMEGGLSERYLGQQIRNLYDSFVCSDILSQRVASLEISGWDTHKTQRDVIEPKLEDLFGDGKALDVLYQELPDDVLNNTVFVIGGEFGRQLAANGDNGTEHGRGTSILVIGNGVQGGVYGEMFPEEELTRLNDKSPDIIGRTTIDSIFSRVCDWVQPGTGDLVFPDRTLSMIEDGVNLDSIFL